MYQGWGVCPGSRATSRTWTWISSGTAAASTGPSPAYTASRGSDKQVDCLDFVQDFYWSQGKLWAFTKG